MDPLRVNLKFRQFALLGLVLILASLTALTACLRATPPPDPTATVTPLPTNTLPATIVLENGTQVMVAQPANPTATPNFEIPNPVQVSELQFFQQGSRVQTIAKLQNSLNESLLRDISYEIVLLDAEGNRLSNAYGSVKYLFPRETTGVVTTLDLLPGLAATNLQFLITGGKQEQGQKYRQPFTLSNISSNTVPTGQMATAWLENKDEITYTHAALNAIAYNRAGELICGGSKPQEFIPSKAKIGVSVPLENCPEPPAVIDFYASLTAQTAALEDGPWQKNIQNLDWGFAVNDSNQLAGALHLKNRTDRVLTGNFFTFTAADAQGNVCLAENQSLDTLWPGEEAVFSMGDLDLPLNCEAETAYIKLVPGEFGTPALAYNPLVVANVALATSEEETTVRVRVVNNLNTNISNALVSVLLRDLSGKITGAGVLHTESIPASGMLEVAVPVIYAGDLNELKPSASATIPEGAIIGN